MATILIKFTDESQYDAKASTIVYRDSTPKRWIDIFGKLVIGDNCIFHSSTDRLYVGVYSSSIPNVSVTFTNIRVADIGLDDFLRISEIIPETLSEFKRPKGPIYRVNTLNINTIFNAAVNKSLISFYIVKQGTQAQILPTLNDGDRVVIIDSNNRLVQLCNMDNGALSPLNLGQGYFNANGKTLQELSHIMTTASKPNHIANINRIEESLTSSNSYQFPSFNDYYNVIHNKSLFANNPPNVGGGIVNNVGNQNNLPNNLNNMVLNTILFGPPGTGKTYSTIDKALNLINDEIDEDRNENKIEFSRLQKEGKIYFTTFHQNMSYEDFIEGIKPVAPEEGDEFLQYEIQDGLFMRACIEATFSYIQSINPNNQGVINNFIDYNSLFDSLYDRVNTAGSESFQTRSEGNVTATTTSQGNFAIRHEGRDKPYTVSRERLSVLYEAFANPDDITSITREFRQLIGGCNATAYWSVLNAIAILRNQNNVIDENAVPQTQNYNLSFEEKKIIVKKYWEQRDVTPMLNTKIEKFVFIIDEINRGNVSQIFGELITLIENDKRIGMPEVLYLNLPYSKSPFAVPPNLYIVGTMNTADRSVEALDTALRRRFVFESKMPDESKITVQFNGISLQNLLVTLNNRLRILKDNDHTIGHAWLMGIGNFEELKNVFKNKIIPLLHEYFYNDYAKLGMVLGQQFITTESTVNNQTFAIFPDSDVLRNQYLNTKTYKVKPEVEWTENDFISIYNINVIN